MGLFDFFKKPTVTKSGPKSDPIFDHPTLGVMENNDGDWVANSVEISLSNEPITVSLIGGESGPCEDSLQGFDYALKNWNEIIKSYGIFDAFYEMHEAYVDGMKLKLVERDKFWETVIPEHLMIASKDEMSFTVTFTWQDPKDGHIITAEIEDGKCVGCPVDG